MKSESCSDPMDVKKMVKEAYGKLYMSKNTCCPEEGSKISCLTLAHTDLLKELSPRKGMTVLDVGSGQGDTVLKIASLVAPTGRAVGIDFTLEGIALAKEKAEKLGLGGVADFRLADAENIPFENNTFDAVISECVVCLIENKQRVINEMARVTKRGGKVITHDVITWLPMPKTIREDPYLYCGCIGGATSIDEYKKMMESADLQDIKTADYTHEIGKILRAQILGNTINLVNDREKFLEIVDFLQRGGIGYALISGIKVNSKP